MDDSINMKFENKPIVLEIGTVVAFTGESLSGEKRRDQEMTVQAFFCVSDGYLDVCYA